MSTAVNRLETVLPSPAADLLAMPFREETPLLRERVAEVEKHAGIGTGRLWQLAENRSRKFLKMQPAGPITNESARRARGPLFSTSMLLARMFPEEQEAFLGQSRRVLKEMLSEKVWGPDPFRVTDNLDLVAAHSCQGLALGLSWCRRDWLDASMREEAQHRLLAQARLYADAITDESVYWCRTYLQNHHWINWCAFYTASCYLYAHGHAAEAAPWLKRCEDELRVLQTYLPSDGSGYEGVMYLQYGLNSLILWMELHQEKTGEDLYVSSPFWQALPRWLLAHQSATGNSYVSHGDGGYGVDDGTPRARHDLSGILAALARRLGHSPSQQAAREVAEATANLPRVLEAEAHKQPNLLLFMDPLLAEKPAWAPTSTAVFEDAGEWICRRQVAGQEILLGAKWGPPGGYASFGRFVEFSKLRRGPDSRSGEVFNPDHVHADMGHFVLLVNGEPLIADMGYGDGKAINLSREAIQSHAHNVVLFGGQGQWIPSHRNYRGQVMPRCLKAGENELSLDLGPAYPGIPLDLYERQFRFNDDGALVISDTIRCRNAVTVIFQLQCLEEIKIGENGRILIGGTTPKIEVRPPPLPHVLDILSSTPRVRRACWLFNTDRTETKLEFQIHLLNPGSS